MPLNQLSPNCLVTRVPIGTLAGHGIGGRRRWRRCARASQARQRSPLGLLSRWTAWGCRCCASQATAAAATAVPAAQPLLVGSAHTHSATASGSAALPHGARGAAQQRLRTDRLGKSKTYFFETARNATKLGTPSWSAQLAEVSALLRPEKPSVAKVTVLKFYFALWREGEALASSSPSPPTFRRAQRAQPPSLHRPPTSSTLGMSKKRPVGVWLKPQARKTTTRHVSSVSIRTDHRHPPRAHRRDRRAEISGVAAGLS